MAERLGKESWMDREEYYLKKLISHSLVVVAERDFTRGIKSCKVHELLYDICLEKAVQDTFLHQVDGNTILGECYSNSQKNEFQLQHRICIHQAGSFTPPKSICTRKQSSTSQVHSLFWSGFHSDMHQCLSSFLGRFKVLTILDLEDLYISAFPLVILDNKHLRYLALRGLIEHIPPSIADLHNLETLIVKRGSRSVVGLPDTLWANGTLKYVDIDRMCLPSPNESYSYGNVEVLCGIVVEYGAKVEEFMRRLIYVKKLKCYCINGVLDPTWFGCFKYLKGLHVKNCYGRSSFMLPNQSLSALHLHKSLMKLVLEECGLPWSVMSTVGSLSGLQVLKLRKRACVGTTWYMGIGEFESLEYLELCDLDLERMDDSACVKTPFPMLKKLLLIHCLGMEDFPTCFNSQLTNLLFLRLETIDVSGSLVSSGQ